VCRAAGRQDGGVFFVLCARRAIIIRSRYTHCDINEVRAGGFALKIKRIVKQTGEARLEGDGVGTSEIQTFKITFYR